jgi:hypothetical protein
MEIDDDVSETISLEEQQIPDDQRHAGDRQERLGHDVGQGPQPGPKPRGKDHGPHVKMRNDKLKMRNQE